MTVVPGPIWVLGRVQSILWTFSSPIWSLDQAHHEYCAWPNIPYGPGPIFLLGQAQSILWTPLVSIWWFGQAHPYYCTWPYVTIAPGPIMTLNWHNLDNRATKLSTKWGTQNLLEWNGLGFWLSNLYPRHVLIWRNFSSLLEFVCIKLICWFI